MLKSGLTAESLKEYAYLGRHDLACAVVLAGDFDAGVSKEKTFKKYKNKGIGLREVKRLTTVTKPWVSRQGVDEKVFFYFQQFLLQLKDEEYNSTREAIGAAETFENGKK